MPSSSSSVSSSSRASSPEPPKATTTKRKRKEPPAPAPADNSDDFDNVDDDSDAEAEAETGDAPSPMEVDEPVLSHAARRKQKREAAKLKASEENGEPVKKKRKVQDGKAKATDAKDNKTPRQNSVWVGNMSFKTQQDDLKRFFHGVGEITRINMPTKAPAGPGVKPENRGFAYVDFATPEAKVTAIALSENPLLGRKLLIKDGDSFEGRPAAIAGENVIADPAIAQKTHSKTAQKILRAQKQPPAPTLFLGNLGFETTEEDIRQLFVAHRSVTKKEKTKETTKEKAEEKDDAKEGTKQVEEGGEETSTNKQPKNDWIRKIRMGTFEDTGNCKGFAFVDFTSIDNATAALINPKNHHLNGRNLVVEYAGADAVRRGQPKSARVPGEGGKEGREYSNGRVKRPLSSGYKKTRGKPEVGAEDEGNAEAGAEADVGAGAGKWNADAPAAASFNPNARRERKERGPNPKFGGSSGFGASEGPTPAATGGFSGRHKGPKSRPKPGAALALAKRESAAIIPTQGKKIVF